MKSWLVVILPALFLSCSNLLNADDNRVFLQSILIEGNRVTRESHVRSFLTAREGQYYDLDGIIDEINKSRKNLEKTGLFTSIFFNDQLNDDGSLILTIVLREKNYLHFGLAGYLGYEDDEFYSNTSLYMDYKNIFGNSSSLFVEIPFYRDYGLILRYDGLAHPYVYGLGISYRHDYLYDYDAGRIQSRLGYRFTDEVVLGADVHISREDVQSAAALQGHVSPTTSLVFLPYSEFGHVERYTKKVKNWYFLTLSPYAGYNFDSSTFFYGVDGLIDINRDLLLQIVYTLGIHASYQGGTVPFDYLIISDIRGAYHDSRAGGDYLLSFVNSLDFPWPTNNKFHVVGFFDFGFIDAHDQGFIAGGGLGFHWYTKYQDPLVFEVAYGKGFMVNLNKRF
jgi:hypothetical protein